MSDEDDEDGYPAPGEQAAFGAAYDAIKRLGADPLFDPVDIGKGVMVAAMHYLRKALPNEEVAQLFYATADDFATRSAGTEEAAEVEQLLVRARRRRSRRGKRVVPCEISDRWLQFPEKSDRLKDGRFMFVDVMTDIKGNGARKLCQLCISKEDLLATLNEVD